MTVIPWADQVAAAKPAGVDRIFIDGVDRTFVREYETLWTDITLTEPFGYGPATLTFPGIHASFDRLGVGDLSWYHPGAEVRIRRVDPTTGEVLAHDHVGVLLAPRRSGRELTIEVGGEFSGRAATVLKHQRAFRYVGDVGHLAQLCVGDVNLTMDPWNGPVTGVKMVDSGGGMYLDSWASQVCAMSLTTDGVQRAIMPVEWGKPVYGFNPKDTSTVHCTIFTNDAGMVIDLVDDVVEKPNRWYGTGITPTGVRIRNIRYPGLMKAKAAPYPISGGGSFTIGTTDADTINDDGITVMQIKLQQMSYFGWDNPITGVFDEVTAEAVIRLKADVNLTVNATMNQNAWERLWDIDATGFSINGAKVFPLLADPRTEKYLYSASGAVIGLNPAYDPSVLPVEREIDFGSGMTKQQMIDWCRGDQARSSGKNLHGTITLTDFGVWAGQWNGSDAAMLNPDPSTGYAGRPDLVLSPRDVRPGWNAWLPLIDGGTLVHISGVQLRRNGPSVTATLTVDTQARDFLEIAALKKRNADARRDVRREWNAANRPGKSSHSGMVPRDEFFGRLHQVEHVTGGQWHVYPMPAGQSGTINRVHVQTYGAETAFAMVIVAEATSEEQLQKELNRRIPNPLAAVPDGADAWWEQDKNKDWFRKRTLLYAAGTHEQPCGYWPRKHTNAKGKTTTAAVTGEWVYDNPFPYLTGEYQPGVVWIGIYAANDTKIKPGQQLWAQEDDVN